MKVLAQVGYGKANHITQGITDGSLTGAILSPRDLTPNDMAIEARSLASNDAVDFIALDPQFYAFRVEEARLRHLESYSYYQGHLTRRQFSQIKKLQEFSTQSLDFQKKLPLTHFIAPAIQLIDLRDSYSQIYMTMAQESLEHAKSFGDTRPVLLSLILDENALLSVDAVDEFLDVLTTWDYQGIYICVQPRSSIYPGALGTGALANFLYLIYVLSELNGLMVVVGYGDLNMLPLGGVGVQYMATGWHNGLKQFSLSRFTPRVSGGGRQARPRYPSLPLLNSILIEPELSEIVDNGNPQYGLSNLSFDQQFNSGVSSSAWPASIAYRAHVAALSMFGNDINLCGKDAKNRIDFVQKRIERAQSISTFLKSEGIVFETRFGFLDAWKDAIAQFIERAELA